MKTNNIGKINNIEKNNIGFENPIFLQNYFTRIFYKFQVKLFARSMNIIYFLTRKKPCYVYQSFVSMDILSLIFDFYFLITFINILLIICLTRSKSIWNNIYNSVNQWYNYLLTLAFLFFLSNSICVSELQLINFFQMQNIFIFFSSKMYNVYFNLLGVIGNKPARC